VVCLSVCRLSHSSTLLKPFGGFKRQFAGTPVGFNGGGGDGRTTCVGVDGGGGLAG